MVQLDLLAWTRAQRSGRESNVELGPQGTIGAECVLVLTPYYGNTAGSECSSLTGEEFSGGATWVYSRAKRLLTKDLGPYDQEMGWRRQPFAFAYKRIWYEDRSFGQGLYNFHFTPFFHELIRRIAPNTVEYDHLFAPTWLVDETYGILCHTPVCPCSSFPTEWSSLGNSFTFEQHPAVILSCTDRHFCTLLQCVLDGSGYGAPYASWTPGARAGRFFWNNGRAAYVPPSSA